MVLKVTRFENRLGAAGKNRFGVVLFASSSIRDSSDDRYCRFGKAAHSSKLSVVLLVNAAGSSRVATV